MYTNEIYLQANLFLHTTNTPVLWIFYGFQLYSKPLMHIALVILKYTLMLKKGKFTRWLYKFKATLKLFQFWCGFQAWNICGNSLHYELKLELETAVFINDLVAYAFTISFCYQQFSQYSPHLKDEMAELNFMLSSPHWKSSHRFPH